ncbi:RNA polymerase sigma factor [Patescibacteria group bacterium]
MKENNEKAFIQLYDKYAPQIYRFVFFKTNSTHDAEDLTSEAFFKFWKNRLGEKNIDNPRAMLYRIANNLITDFYRKRSKKELSLIDSDKNVLNIAGEIDLYRKAEFDSELKEIVKSINKIKGEYQNIIIWHYLEDFSIKEISQITEKPQGSIRVLLYRAMKSLKKGLNSNK